MKSYEPVKLNNKHFNYFVERCRYYMDLLKYDIDAVFRFDDIGDGYYCVYDYDYHSNSVVFTLNTVIYADGAEAGIKKELDDTAFHEVLESLLHKAFDKTLMVNSMMSEDSTKDKIKIEIRHSLLNKLRGLYDGSRKSRLQKRTSI